MKDNYQKQIDDLKRRIELLEQRPVYYPVYPTYPLYPTTPTYSAWGGTITSSDLK